MNKIILSKTNINNILNTNKKVEGLLSFLFDKEYEFVPNFKYLHTPQQLGSLPTVTFL